MLDRAMMTEVDVVVVIRDDADRALAAERTRRGQSVRIVDESADGSFVWIVEPGGRVGISDGTRSEIVHAREVIGAPDQGIGSSGPSEPIWDRPVQAPLHPIALGALATEEQHPVPRIPAVDEVERRIQAEVAAGKISPFVLPRLRRRADEVRYRLGSRRSPADAEVARSARALEDEIRAGAARR
jgi:hypothetical protein